MKNVNRYASGSWFVLAIAMVVALALLLNPRAASAAPTPPTPPAPPAIPHAPHVDVCDHAIVPGLAHCDSSRRTDNVGTPARSVLPSAGPRSAASPNVTATPNTIGNNGAYDPSYLQSAYNLASVTASAGSGRLVAIVDAYDAPSAESDLGSYRSYFGLTACTTANGCFKKVNQNGVQGSYPSSNSGWAQEISLDVDMVSAICPNCSILLVEANSNSMSDLGTAVNTAASMGAVAISNSYGGGEFSSETTYESYYNHSGIAVTASSGDSGYGVEFPAASQYVTAVGGTTLTQLTNTGTRNGSETAWSGAGSGCSAYVTKPTWQHDPSCSRRTVADVSADADPNTGVWVRYNNSWYIFGGTSVASPIIASVYGLSGTSANAGSAPYQGGTLFDVTSGSNGSCGGSYLCTAVVGYDGPTGLGTPNGTSAFGGSVAAPTGVISFSTAAQSLVAGNASAGITLQITDANNQPLPPTSDLTVNLSTTSAGGGFVSSSTSTTWTSTASVTVPANSATSATFYYRDTLVGSPTLTASATGYTSGTQNETVSAAPLASITLSPASATVQVNATQGFSAAGADAFGNAVSVASATWSVSPSSLGTVSPATGASTTFTAGSAAGTGTVTATIGSISGSANVSVTSVVVPAPTNLTAVAKMFYIRLSWYGSSGVTYRVYRGTSSTSITTLLASGLTNTIFNDTSAQRGVTYYYQVTAVNSSGVESARSNIASARR